MTMKTPKTGGPNIAKGTPVMRRVLGSLEDGEEVDFTKWTDEDRVTKMNEQNFFKFLLTVKITN